MSPARSGHAARHGHERRWPALFAVAAVIAGIGIGVGAREPTTTLAPAVPTALVSPPDAESSAWYCTGHTTSPGPAPGLLVLSNPTARAVTAHITVVTDAGSTSSAAVSVPAQSVVAPATPASSSGSWEADTVTVDGGGVSVAQAVHGPAGWSVVACQSSTSSHWYFASGSTVGSNALYVTILNPTSSKVVVDVGFMTPTGAVQPINYQGVVLDPGATLAENVASEVQNASQVSTVVTARTGRVVASEVQTYTGASAGLSVVPGQSRPEGRWALPLAEETAGGGSSEIDVFNPGGSPEKVTVQLRLGSGPLAPLTDKVPPGETWVVATSRQTRIPAGAYYSAEVTATGGPGVVVSRAVLAPASAVAPQAGITTAVDGLTSAVPAGEWIVPPPGTQARPAVTGAAREAVALFNVSNAAETFIAESTAPGRKHLLASGTLEPGQSEIVSGSALSDAGFDPVVVRASGPMAVTEYFAPSGGVGAVATPGVPLGATLGL